MKKISNKSLFILLAVLMILGISVGATFAYFTDYDILRGSAALNMKNSKEIVEDVTDTTKTVSIKSSDDSADSVVRLLIYGPDGMKVTPDTPSDWAKFDYGDGSHAYYYTKVMKAGESTSNVVASVADIPKTADLLDFQIIVLQESAIAEVGDDGYIVAPDGWNGFPRIKA